MGKFVLFVFMLVFFMRILFFGLLIKSGNIFIRRDLSVCLSGEFCMCILILRDIGIGGRGMLK